MRFLRGQKDRTSDYPVSGHGLPVSRIYPEQILELGSTPDKILSISIAKVDSFGTEWHYLDRRQRSLVVNTLACEMPRFDSLTDNSSPDVSKTNVN